MIVWNPEVIPDVHIAAKVRKVFSLMKRSRNTNQARESAGIYEGCSLVLWSNDGNPLETGAGAVS